MADRSAFFYGTLMAPEVLYRVCYGGSRPTSTEARSAPPIRTTAAILPDYCRHRVRHCDYPAIVPAPGSSVRGTLVRGLTASDLARLDRFEGDQYERKRVRVRPLLLQPDEQREDAPRRRSEGGDAIETETYVWSDSDSYLDAREWDFEAFRREKMWRWAGAREDDELDELDQAVGTSQPDSVAGKELHGAEDAGPLEGGGERLEEVLHSAV
ncbi:MAG: hypothetical protein M1826_001382 [Phylliscum demangeonii]|nr:MAG: hypothetical protein M1826_001382 [Phylliscum demangeonii]